jgi:hypothetical protein
MEEGEIEVDSIEPIGLPNITPQLARESGFLGVVDLLNMANHGPAFMESVRSIEPRQRPMWNMIALTRRHPSESNSRCSIFGPRVVHSTLSMQKTAVRWAFGVNGLRERKGMKGGHFFPENNPEDTAALVTRFLAAEPWT